MNLKEARRLRQDDVAVVQELVALLSAGESPRPRVDFGRLSDGEAIELVELAEAINRGDADRGDQKFWSLVAAASAFDRDHFRKRHEQAKAARKAAEREAKERRMLFGRRETRNLFLALHEALVAEDVWADDVLVLTLVLLQLAAGKPLRESTVIEGSGDDATLVVDANLGFAGRSDGTSAATGWRQRAAFLHEERWLRVESKGHFVRMRPGPRLAEALAGVLVPEEATR